MSGDFSLSPFGVEGRLGMSPRPPFCRLVVLEVAAMSCDGILRDSSWHELLPRRASVSVQVDEFALASRLVV
eukprot:553484-Alexandrium_andersonii.AAC.1